MIRHRIVFPAVGKAELVREEIPAPTGKQVLVRVAVSTVSPGTERANVSGNDSISVREGPSVVFPRYPGYSSAGVVEAIGEEVTTVSVGDRVAVYYGFHTDLSLVTEDLVVKIEDDKISLAEAALAFIMTFPLNAHRKVDPELGESLLVMGLGLLGQFSVRFAKAAGCTPVIAVDPVESRRLDALAGGADAAFDPFAPGFAEEVRALTGGGAHTAIEVTGFGAGLDETLDCMAHGGRVALLGCTRDKNFTIDYYRKVHYPGISLIGAHNLARAETESRRGSYTHSDEIRNALRLISYGRVNVREMIRETRSPAECGAVYDRLLHDRDFPMVVQFDWSRLPREDKP